MDRRRLRRCGVPGTRSVKIAVAQHNANDAGRLKDLTLKRNSALHGQLAYPLGINVERILFAKHALARRIDKGDALGDDTRYPDHLRGLHQVSCTLDAQTAVGLLRSWI